MTTSDQRASLSERLCGLGLDRLAGDGRAPVLAAPLSVGGTDRTLHLHRPIFWCQSNNAQRFSVRVLHCKFAINGYAVVSTSPPLLRRHVQRNGSKLSGGNHRKRPWLGLCLQTVRATRNTGTRKHGAKQESTGTHGVLLLVQGLG